MAKLTFDFSAIQRMRDRIGRLDEKALSRVRQRTVATIARRLPTEASRSISAKLLNVSTRTALNVLSVRTGQEAGGDAVILSGSERRLGLQEFGIRVTKKQGATATLWRDSGPIKFPHAFRTSGGKSVLQRVPSGSGKLVPRLPLVIRKGPSIQRTVVDKKHGDIYPELIDSAQNEFSKQVDRLVNVELRK